VLEALVRLVPCEGALLAIRSADSFFVDTIWHISSPLKGASFTISASKTLTGLTVERQGEILEDISAYRDDGFLRTLSTSYKSCMVVPIMIGQQVIGLFAFVSAQAVFFKRKDLKQATLQAGHLASAVETRIMFSEAVRYMQQFALLNEIASAASQGGDTLEVARRVLDRLCRTFHTQRAKVFLLSPDGSSLREYGEEGQSIADVALANSLTRYVIETGFSYRWGEYDETHQPQAKSLAGLSAPAACSALGAPLKYRGAVIGSISLESGEKDAFSLQDEQLLVVIASHLAGLFENMRLNEETRERALKLQENVRQLQTVRETALEISGNLDLDELLRRVVHRARELVDAHAAEIGFWNEAYQAVEILVSDAPWVGTPERLIPKMVDIAGRVITFGEPIAVEDYNSWSGRLSFDSCAPFHTAAGVPLVFQGEVIGVLIVKDERPEKIFQPQDIQLLELLAPLVTVWIRNARLYQELQERIKAQQLAESRLIRSARLAAVGEMAAGVAHELNNPLTSVAGFVELVLEELPADSPHRPDLELVLREAQRARGVVRRLLDFSRPVENQRFPTDLNELTRDVLALIQHLARTGGVEIRLELSNGLPAISVDPAQIKQVLLNLIHNAIQAMPTGGKLTIKTAPVETGGKLWIRISVSDTGVGISPENLVRIFEPFFTTRPAGQGTGLGLSVSYGIVNEHGGYIEVESFPDQGSCFTVFLPVKQDFEQNEIELDG